MSTPLDAPASSYRHTYQEIAHLYPKEWVAFVAHGPERYEVVATGSDLTALMQKAAATAYAGRVSFAYLSPAHLRDGRGHDLGL